MAEEISEFMLEDEPDEYKGTGFADAGDLPVVNDEAEPDEPEEQEAQEEPTAEAEEPEPDEPKEELEPEKKDDDSPLLQRLAEMQNQFAQQQAVIANLQQRIEAAAKLNVPKQEEQGPPPAPSEDDWADNPTKAAEMIAKRERYEMERQFADRQAQERQSAQLQEQQRTSYINTTKAFPELNDANSQFSKVVAQQYHANKDYWDKHPAAAWYLATSAKSILEMQGIQVNTGYGQAKDEQAIKQAQASGIKQEQARQARVKQGVMHGSGTGGGKSKVVNISDMHRRAARDLGLTEEAYAASLKEMGVKNG